MIDFVFNFQGLGFILGLLLTYVAIRTRNSWWLAPVGAYILFVLFWSPIKFVSPDRTKLERPHQSFDVAPKEEVKVLSLEETQNNLKNKAKDHVKETN